MALPHCMLVTEGYKHTLRTMFARMHLDVILYVQRVSCFSDRYEYATCYLEGSICSRHPFPEATFLWDYVRYK